MALWPGPPFPKSQAPWPGARCKAAAAPRPRSRRLVQVGAARSPLPQPVPRARRRSRARTPRRNLQDQELAQLLSRSQQLVAEINAMYEHYEVPPKP